MPGTAENRLPVRAPALQGQEIREYVARLLATPHFSAASRRGQLLEYLVEHTLAGDADKISEYAIGLDVFRKPDSFDPRIESLVRTEVSRLRQRLKDYYADEGRRDPIVIDFPPRSYVASFGFRDAKAFVEIAPPPQQPLVPAHSSRLSRWMVIPLIVAVAVVVGVGILLWRRHLLGSSNQPINSIVVLPFENFSPGHEDEYIADGMTEELTNDLAQWRDLRVVARTSAFAFKGKGEDIRKIGEQLNVDAVLEGSFTREGDHVRITAQLNRASDGYHLWSHSYESETKDLMATQEDVANSISAAIGQIRGGGSPPPIHVATTNSEAHDLYLQGMYQFHLQTPQSQMKAAQLFQAAIDKDPNFARAYFALGVSVYNSVTFSVLSSQAEIPRVRQLMQKAIELDSNYGDAYAFLALVDYDWDWDWSRAEMEYRRALELRAGSSTRVDYGWSLATRGRFAEAHEQYRQAAELDPLASSVPFDEFFAYNFERNVPGQKQSIDRLLKIDPHFIGAHALDVVVSVEQHDCVKASSEANWMAKNYPTLSVTQSLLAFAAGCGNDKPEVLRRIKRMMAMKAQAYQVAIAYALIHDTDNAIAQLNISADQHEGQIHYLKYDPFFDEIRSDPRYVALEKRVGLL